MSDSDQRDEELDAMARDLQQPGSPYVERPDEHQVGTGALCFLERSRVCGADCASYVPGGMLPGDRCQILLAASTLTRFIDRMAYTQQAAEIPPPNPFGGKP